jgi:hypothetical protein
MQAAGDAFPSSVQQRPRLRHNTIAAFAQSRQDVMNPRYLTACLRIQLALRSGALLSSSRVHQLAQLSASTRTYSQFGFSSSFEVCNTKISTTVAPGGAGVLGADPPP